MAMIATTQPMRRESSRRWSARGIKHILVVDDDVCVRKCLKMRLESAGYSVATASSGSEGIACFDEGGADLVILDISMPDVDGFEVCKVVKHRGDVPVIFLTGARNPIIRDYLPQMVDAVRGDYFLRKPFDTKLLMKLVSEILNN